MDHMNQSHQIPETQDAITGLQAPQTQNSATPKFSVLVPAHNEEKFIGKCLESIRAAAKHYPQQVEMIVALNRCTDRTQQIAESYGAITVKQDEKSIAKTRNAAARAARGEIILTIDADSAMSGNMLQEIDKAISGGKYIGGGVRILPDRYSPGIIFTGLVLIPILLVHRFAGGLFWCRRATFEALGGFNENMVSVEDIDFSRRLRLYGKARGLKFTTLWKPYIVTSTRKADYFGDWHLLRNPGLVLRLLTGRDRAAADQYYYDVRR
jgi:glycosyltransferase involved in cell wall biosynthesis